MNEHFCPEKPSKICFSTILILTETETNKFFTIKTGTHTGGISIESTLIQRHDVHVDIMF